MKKHILYILLACFGFSEAFAQMEMPSTQGSEFYLSFIKANPKREKTMLLIVSAERIGKLEFTDANGLVTTKNFNAGTTIIEMVSTDDTDAITGGDLRNCYTTLINQESKTGYKIVAFENDGTTLQKVSLYAGLSGDDTADFGNVYPIEALGNEYIVVSHAGMTKDSYPQPSEALVVATRDGTEIEVVPACLLEGYGDELLPAFTVTLNKGEVYQLRAKSPNSGDKGQNDLSGTVFRTKKGTASECYPIAVFTGGAHSNPGDYEYEQLFPTHLWGKNYLVTTPQNESNEVYVRVMAAQGCTEVKVDGVLKATLNQTEYYEYTSPSGGSYIEASKPVEVAFFTAPESGGSSSDASMTVLAPVEQMLEEIVFVAPYVKAYGSDFSNYKVSIVTPTKFMGDIHLKNLANSTELTLSGWVSVAGTNDGYKSIAVNVDAGTTYQIIADAGGFNAIVYAYGGNPEYSFSVGSKAQTEIDLGIGSNPENGGKPYTSSELAVLECPPLGGTQPLVPFGLENIIYSHVDWEVFEDADVQLDTDGKIIGINNIGTPMLTKTGDK
ncbi:MAG: IgGFc-binding protein, partial [Prevotellaceae bacterium]|nr:IgGFc-binding protein [Prevotellaceae bacterium]